jgi:hypothetical protein
MLNTVETQECECRDSSWRHGIWLDNKGVRWKAHYVMFAFGCFLF